MVIVFLTPKYIVLVIEKGQTVPFSTSKASIVTPLLASNLTLQIQIFYKPDLLTPTSKIGGFSANGTPKSDITNSEALQLGARHYSPTTRPPASLHWSVDFLQKRCRVASRGLPLLTIIDSVWKIIIKVHLHTYVLLYVGFFSVVEGLPSNFSLALDDDWPVSTYIHNYIWKVFF